MMTRQISKHAPATHTSAEAFTKRVQETLRGQEDVTGAQLVVASLEALAPEHPGIKHIAGHHGGAILPFYEHYTKSELHKGYIHAPNEQIAGFIAKGLANVDADAGVAIATSGPGATNLITPFYDAYMDSVPLVFITGNVPTTAAGSRAFQEAPIKEMVAPTAKAVHYVTDARDIPKTLHEAFSAATSGRPGPVWIDLPKDTQQARIHPAQARPATDTHQPTQTRGHGYDALREQLRRCQRPVIYAGGGIKSAKAWDELRAFANAHAIPVTTTLKAKGVFDENKSLSLGMLGMHGTAYANHAVDNADLLLVIGARFDDRVTGDPETFAQEAYIAHIDIDPQGIGPGGRQPELTIRADAASALKELNDKPIQTRSYGEWHRRIAQWKKQYPLAYDTTSDWLKPQHAIEIHHELTQGTHAIVADVGQHQMWAAQHYPSADPRGFDTSGGSGTMGCSLAQALGAYRMRKEMGDQTPVTVMCGDESFMMNPQALHLYAQQQPDITVLVFDNKKHDGTPGGMVRQWYDQSHAGAKNPVAGSQRITEIAQGFGIRAAQATTPAQSRKHITQALNTPGPHVITLKVDPAENCLPMMPPGGTVQEMITYQDKYT